MASMYYYNSFTLCWRVVIAYTLACTLVYSLARLLKQHRQLDMDSTAVTIILHKCPMYREFRDLDFQLHPSLRRSLCQNVDEAFRRDDRGGGDFPMCLLSQRAVSQDLMLRTVIIAGSHVARLYCIGNDSSVSIFVYKGNDLLSRTVKELHTWEPQLVRRTLGLALKIPETTFMDIGSNIGVYSIQAAKLRLPVVALDANIRNLLRLRLSLNAASLHATLVWNFIAVDQNLKYLSFLADCNVGGAGRDNASLPDTIPVMPLRSERLASLIKTKNIVMKMDIQGGEAEFLQTSGRLFSDFNVAAVQMEWYRPMIYGNDSFVIAQFFSTRGYQVYRIPDLQPLDPERPHEWGQLLDILWIRRQFLRYL